eukprot:2829240-Rhodomonas_salina.1
MPTDSKLPPLGLLLFLFVCFLFQGACWLLLCEPAHENYASAHISRREQAGIKSEAPTASKEASRKCGGGGPGRNKEAQDKQQGSHTVANEAAGGSPCQSIEYPRKDRGNGCAAEGHWVSVPSWRQSRVPFAGAPDRVQWPFGSCVGLSLQPGRCPSCVDANHRTLRTSPLLPSLPPFLPLTPSTLLSPSLSTTLSSLPSPSSSFLSSASLPLPFCLPLLHSLPLCPSLSAHHRMGTVQGWDENRLYYKVRTDDGYMLGIFPKYLAFLHKVEPKLQCAASSAFAQHHVPWLGTEERWDDNKKSHKMCTSVDCGKELPSKPVSVEIPDQYRCPLTLEVMEDPVVAKDGH